MISMMFRFLGQYTHSLIQIEKLAFKKHKFLDKKIKMKYLDTKKRIKR